MLSQKHWRDMLTETTREWRQHFFMLSSLSFTCSKWALLLPWPHSNKSCSSGSRGVLTGHSLPRLQSLLSSWGEWLGSSEAHRAFIWGCCRGQPWGLCHGWLHENPSLWFLCSKLSMCIEISDEEGQGPEGIDVFHLPGHRRLRHFDCSAVMLTGISRNSIWLQREWNNFFFITDRNSLRHPSISELASAFKIAFNLLFKDRQPLNFSRWSGR